MREKRTAARRLPFKPGAGIGLHRQQHQPLNPGKIFGGGFSGLCGCGKMHITVSQINRRAQGLAPALQGLPLFGAENFVNDHGLQMPCIARLVNIKMA